MTKEKSQVRLYATSRKVQFVEDLFHCAGGREKCLSILHLSGSRNTALDCCWHI